jgi:hypothetical protein
MSLERFLVFYIWLIVIQLGLKSCLSEPLWHLGMVELHPINEFTCNKLHQALNVAMSTLVARVMWRNMWALTTMCQFRQNSCICEVENNELWFSPRVPTRRGLDSKKHVCAHENIHSTGKKCYNNQASTLLKKVKVQANLHMCLTLSRTIHIGWKAIFTSHWRTKIDGWVVKEQEQPCASIQLFIFQISHWMVTFAIARTKLVCMCAPLKFNCAFWECLPIVKQDVKVIQT